MGRIGEILKGTREGSLLVLPLKRQDKKDFRGDSPENG